MNINELIVAIRHRRDCRVYPPAGFPQVKAGFELPKDLHAFYAICGGADLFEGQLGHVSIHAPNEFRHSNTVIGREESEDDRSFSWYLIASDVEEQISIDLSCERLGWCYDSFWDGHAMPGSCAVFAKSFTEFVVRCLESEGKYYYWATAPFVAYGDAYDDL
jgi:hypothetical protein